MDEALQYFTEAQMHIDAFIDIPLADAFFEETDEIRAINESNEEHRTGAIASLQKAFKVIIDRLKEAFSRMTEAIKSQFMTKEEKERYKKFVSMVNSDPELAKVKVTIQDFREYEKIYDEALKKLEDEANKDDPSLTVVNEIVSVMQNKLNILKDDAKDAATRAALSVSMKTALDIADRNQTCAKAINYAIKKEIINMEAISKELGESRAAKFEKKIEKLSKAGRVHRIISNILHHKERDLNSIIKRQFTDLMSFTNFDDNSKPVVTKGSIIRGGIKNRQVLIDAAGGKKEAAKLAKDMGVSALKYKKYEKEAKKALKSAKKSGQELKDFVLGKK